MTSCEGLFVRPMDGKDVNLSMPNRWHRIDELLLREVDEGRLPGAVYAVGVGQDVLAEGAVGYSQTLHGVQRVMQKTTLFDLASLTKVVATLPSLLTLIDAGELRLDDPVALFIPAFTHVTPPTEDDSPLSEARSQVTVRHLLTHTSGLPSHRLYYLESRSREEVLDRVIREPLEAMPGTRVVYSDLGFILLGEIAQAVSGKRIDKLATERIWQPLSMHETQYCPDSSLKWRIAATEEFADVGVKVGVVHDENTHAMDGVSGHAGLFAPLPDLVRYVQMWHARHTILSPVVRQVATQCFTNELVGRRGLGWACRYDSFDHTGDLWPETTVGHTGFTGTSIAFDPVRQWWAILLTNEVHYGRVNRTIGRLRARVHNMVAATLSSQTEEPHIG